MKIIYEIKERKPFVKDISEYLKQAAIYQKTPTYAYKIGDITVTKEGNIEISELKNECYIKDLINYLQAKGYTAKNKEEIEKARINADEEIKLNTKQDLNLTVAIPKDKVNLLNLEKLLQIKSDIIKKALAVDQLIFEEKEDKIIFPWFKETDADKIMTYTNFISSLCKMSINSKRINETSKKIINEKYTFRCFLLRLGFIGDEYKKDRKILLEKLTGSSAFRTGSKKDEILN